MLLLDGRGFKFRRLLTGIGMAIPMEDAGGYETWLGTNKVEVQASTKIVNALLEMFAELK